LAWGGGLKQTKTKRGHDAKNKKVNTNAQKQVTDGDAK